MVKFSGTKDEKGFSWEKDHRNLARYVAAEGMVLMKNTGLLPLSGGEKVALFGGGALHPYKGGTGSGDVNSRATVSIYDGLLEEDVKLVNTKWILEYKDLYEKRRQAWREEIWKAVDDGERPGDEFALYTDHMWHMPMGRDVKEEDIEGIDTAIYVISRKSGESEDRTDAKGDYELSEWEIRNLNFLCDHVENVVVLLNVGGPINVTRFMLEEHVKGILNISQPGMEAGHAVADVLTGRVTPSGKLTATWGTSYEKYPEAMEFSHISKNLEEEVYKEDIYMGYKYFDSFDVMSAYGFGFGLSYTEFMIDVKEVTTDLMHVHVTCDVFNVGNKYAGKEVVQVYVSMPQELCKKEYRRLVGFAKTGLLKPGEKQEVTISFSAKDMASFHEKGDCFILEAGDYGLWVGESLENASLHKLIEVETQVLLEHTSSICKGREEIQTLDPGDKPYGKEQRYLEIAGKANLERIIFAPRPGLYASEEKKEVNPAYEAAKEKAKEIVASLTREELAKVLCGQPGGRAENVGVAGIHVPGAAGETTGELAHKGIPLAVMADGPAGLRIQTRYEANETTGQVYPLGFLENIEGGELIRNEKRPDCQYYYQYSTAIPIGTCLAQTFDLELLKEVGKMIGEEMRSFGVHFWLAPGMNLQRNPLCGRNFEYFSEDPVVSGLTAAALTQGVQSVPGCTVTLKHFACNNSEENRMGVDCKLTVRNLRENYLRGFEIAIKKGKPLAIMTSYNHVNGFHSAASYDLCTRVLREDFGFDGMIMTDWGTTFISGKSTPPVDPWRCAAAGNDLIMPGIPADQEGILKGMEEGFLSEDRARECAQRIVAVVLYLTEAQNQE